MKASARCLALGLRNIWTFYTSVPAYLGPPEAREGWHWKVQEISSMNPFLTPWSPSPASPQRLVYARRRRPCLSECPAQHGPERNRGWSAMNPHTGRPQPASLDSTNTLHGLCQVLYLLIKSRMRRLAQGFLHRGPQPWLGLPLALLVQEPDGAGLATRGLRRADPLLNMRLTSRPAAC